MMIFKLKTYLYMAKNLIYNLRSIFFFILKFKLPLKKNRIALFIVLFEYFTGRT